MIIARIYSIESLLHRIKGSCLYGEPPTHSTARAVSRSRAAAPPTMPASSPALSYRHSRPPPCFPRPRPHRPRATYRPQATYRPRATCCRQAGRSRPSYVVTELVVDMCEWQICAWWFDGPARLSCHGFSIVPSLDADPGAPPATGVRELESVPLGVRNSLKNALSTTGHS